MSTKHDLRHTFSGSTFGFKGASVSQTNAGALRRSDLREYRLSDRYGAMIFSSSHVSDNTTILHNFLWACKTNPDKRTWQDLTIACLFEAR